MPSHAERISKELEKLTKVKKAHREKVNKLYTIEARRILSILKKTDYFKYDFTNDDLIEGINAMVAKKSSPQNKKKVSKKAPAAVKKLAKNNC